MPAQTDDQLLALIAQYFPDNTTEEITPDDLRDVLEALVRAKASAADLVGFAQLASPVFSGAPQVPTAAPGTATDQVASTAFVLAALATGGKGLVELALPQAVAGGQWYLVPTGIWEARYAFNATAAPAPGANWRAVASFSGAASVAAAGITDATAAGRAMLTAADAPSQLALVDKLTIAANSQGGTHPAFSRAYGPPGLLLWLLRSVVAVQSAAPVLAPAAPANVSIDDAADTMAMDLVAGFVSIGDYEAYGVTGVPGTVPFTQVGDVQGGRLVLRGLTGPHDVGTVGVRVAGTGNRPAGAWAMNDRAFTGSPVVVPDPTTTPDAPDVDFNEALRVLTASHPLYGTADLEYRHGTSGVVLAYAAIGVDSGAHAAKEWQYRVKAATGRAASGWADSPAIAAAALPQPVAPSFSGFDDVANTVSVSHPTLPYSELVYDFAGATGLAVPANLVISVGNAAGQVTAYARALANRPEGVRQNSQVFTLTAANTAPTVTLSSPQAGQSVAAGSMAVLNASPQDAENNLARVEFLDNGVKFTETTVAPHTVQVAVTAGAHNYTARVVDTGGLSNLSNAVPVTGAASTGPVVGVPATADYSDSSNILRVSASGYVIRAAGASVRRRTNAAYTDISVRTTYSDGGITVFVDGVNAGHYSFSAANTYRIALPNDGQFHTVKAVLGQQLRASENGDVNGTELLSFTEPAGSTSSFVVPAKANRLVLFFGNSISNGARADDPSVSGAAGQLRNANQDVLVIGYGSAQAQYQLGTAYRNVVKSLIDYIAAGYNEVVVLVTVGTNDNITQTAAYSLFLNFFTWIHTTYPTFKVGLQTVLTRYDEAAAGTPAMRAGQAQAATAYGVYFEDGTNVLDRATQISDDRVHPNQAGYNVLAPAWQHVIDNATVPTAPAVAPPPPETTFSDNLVNNAAGRWVNLSDGSGRAMIANGMTLQQGDGDSQVSHINLAHWQSAIRYDMRGKFFKLRVSGVPSGDPNAAIFISVGDGVKGSKNSCNIAVVNGATVYGEYGDSSIGYAPVTYSGNINMAEFVLSFSTDGSMFYLEYGKSGGLAADLMPIYSGPTSGPGYSIPVANAWLDLLTEQGYKGAPVNGAQITYAAVG